MAKAIVEFEARRDPKGRLAVYLPAGLGELWASQSFAAP
jgi:hypothetical protein